MNEHTPRTGAPPLRRPALATAMASALLAGVALTAITVTTLVSSPDLTRVSGLSPLSIPGRGATVAFKEIEAEDAPNNGTVLAHNRVYGTLASEASGRQAVTLDAVGEYVEFTMPIAADSINFRYSIPDGPSGQGRDASIELRINGNVLKSVPVTSKYGWYYGGYPFNNNPGDTNPHHFYDEQRTLFGSTYPAGTKVRLQVGSTAQSPSFTIDLADFELVGGPKTKPTGALDVVADFGADPNGGSGDNTAKFQAAVDAGKAQGRVVWVPAGTYNLWDHVIVDGVTLQGAGPWHSVLTGRHPTQRNKAVGLYGKYVNQGGPSRNVIIKDLAIIGDIQERVDDDQVNAVGGAMSNSTLDNVWLQHTKCGAWMDGPMDRFVIKNSRILDQTADGVNFHTGVTNSQVTNTFVRNTGDDGLAMWPQDIPNVNNSFDHNTVGVTILANNIVTYGGRDIKITDNVTADSITNGGGIHIANRYPGVNSGAGTAVAGTITVARNTLIRNGNSDYNWNFGVGAIWFSGLNEPISGATINITDTDIYDSSYAALHWIEGSSSGINLSNVRIMGTGTYALQVQASSQVTFNNVTATGVSQSNPIHNCVGPSFQVTQTGTNTGWYANPPACTGVWPAPNWSGTHTGTPSPIPSSTVSPSTPASPSASPSPSTSPSQPPVGTNLAAGKPTSASTNNGPYGSGNAVDGNVNTYWESANNAFPQSITVDLGSAQNVGRVVTKLPPSWGTRTENVTVLTSTDGSTFSQAVGNTPYTLNPATGNSATITFATRSARYVRLTVTGNNGWPAAQFSEFEVYQVGTPPTGPVIGLSTSSLAFGNQNTGSTSGSQAVTVSNTGNASAALGAVAISGDYARTTTCGATLAAGASCSIAVTFTPTGTGTRFGTVSLTSNAPGSPHTVALSGTGTTTPPPNTNLALNRPTSETSHADVYGAGNVVDGNANSYWESANNAFPQSVTVDLGSSTSVSRVVLKLPPASAWQTRSQTVAVLGSTTGSGYTTLSGAASYSFNPATGNTVTITFPATSQRYLRLTFTANTGWPAGQLSEFEAYAS